MHARDQSLTDDRYAGPNCNAARRAIQQVVTVVRISEVKRRRPGRVRASRVGRVPWTVARMLSVAAGADLSLKVQVLPE